LPMLSPKGWLITNIEPFINIPNYPEMDAIIAEIEKLPFFVALDAELIAKEIGSVRSANMVMLGAASPFLDIDYNFLENAISKLFGKKGDKIVGQNLEAMKAGRKVAEEKIGAK
jgi:indolepyruvate ferredoxin oxidoreductase beta subunit